MIARINQILRALITKILMSAIVIMTSITGIVIYSIVMMNWMMWMMMMMMIMCIKNSSPFCDTCIFQAIGFNNYFCIDESDNVGQVCSNGINSISNIRRYLH